MQEYASGLRKAEAMRRCFSKPLNRCEEPDKTALDVESWKELSMRVRYRRAATKSLPEAHKAPLGSH